MAFKKKPATSDEVFVLTLPLRCEPWMLDLLDVIFQCYNNVKNALIQKFLKVLKQMERTKAWRNIQSELAELYKQLKTVKPDSKEESDLKKKIKSLNVQRNTMIKAYGLTKSNFEKSVKPMQKHYKKNVNSAVAQKLSYDVWAIFEEYLYGNGKKIHFSKATDFTTIEGKSNESGLRFIDNKAVIGKDLKIPVSLNRKDTYGYETEALSRDIHFCKLTRCHGEKRWLYSIQLVLSGKPPVKVIQTTGEVLHTLGKGRVGNDPGTQTLAVASNTSVKLFVLCEQSKVQNIEDEIRLINRAMDRSRRATNPKMFNEKGEIVTIDKLLEECTVTIHGKKYRKWIKSKRYRHLEQRRRYLYHKQAVQREQCHKALANQLLSLGDEHYIESMNWQALAKRAKKTEISEKTGKYKRKKRYGKAVANKAPALFVKIYENKVKNAGGQFYKINTQKAKASQYNHENKTYKKKNLSKRWNKMPDGTKIQRDLYSAFLIQYTNETLDGFIQSLLEENFENFKKLHDAEIERLQFVDTPSSTGVKKIA